MIAPIVCGGFVLILFFMQYLLSFQVLHSSCCCVAETVIFLFLTVPCVGLQCVIVALPGSTHF